MEFGILVGPRVAGTGETGVTTAGETTAGVVDHGARDLEDETEREKLYLMCSGLEATGQENISKTWVCPGGPKIGPSGPSQALWGPSRPSVCYLLGRKKK